MTIFPNNFTETILISYTFSGPIGLHFNDDNICRDPFVDMMAKGLTVYDFFYRKTDMPNGNQRIDAVLRTRLISPHTPDAI